MSYLTGDHKYVRLLDGSGNSLTSTGGKLDCEITAELSGAGLALETTLDSCKTALEGTLTVDGSGVTQPVSASSLDRTGWFYSG